VINPRNLKLIFCVAFLSFSVSSFSEARYEIEGETLKITQVAAAPHICKINEEVSFVVPSFDKSALIVSETGYLKKHEVDECTERSGLHVFHIPDGVGFLSDINLSKGIYVSLDFVTTQPFTWLATVAYLGKTKNLVSLNGAYVKGKPLKQLRSHSFGGSGDAGMSAISPDGRFVAPNGDISCSDDSYPGVWDIEKNKRVAIDKRSCALLFSTKKSQ
jgi:hypothetical protein